MNPILRIDNPGCEWLAAEREYVASKGLNRFGTPAVFGAVTGYFDRYVLLPVAVLRNIPGLRNEQQNVRASDFKRLLQVAHATGRFPLLGNGTDTTDNPFVQIDCDGQPWVNEGNHRILVAAELDWDFVPVLVRYFAGGEQSESILSPHHVVVFDQSARMAGATITAYGGRKRTSSGPNADAIAIAA